MKAVPLLICLLLSGCVTQVVRTVDLTPPRQSAVPLTEEQLLDVGVAIFDSNIPEDYDVQIEQLIQPEIRLAEARYMPFVAKNLLQSTGNWGAVRVIPRATDAVDLTLHGRILESDGERLVIEARVTDATGRLWFAKQYTGLASKYAYTDSSAQEIDPFQSVYRDIADDMLSYRESLSLADVSAIRQTAEIKFARSFASDAFADYLAQQEDGQYRLIRLPAENDPMLKRVRDIREREYLFIDTLDDFYANHYRQMDAIYDGWRAATYADAIEYKALQAQSRSQIIGGSIAIAAGIGGVYSSDNPYVDASSVATVGAGAGLIISGLNKKQQSAQLADRLREIGADAEAELIPTTIQLDRETLRLTGTVDEQYTELRKILDRLYRAEFGLGSSNQAQSSNTDP
ncbi:MAG: hypothetical protein VX142_04985 [Pseudomonadota bacterium]|nr:hypothetical protein [Pseudomonadota bacterium]